eukprot:m.287000 g.287000  ORF g.287000 m.287000 type:complete len:2472 (+) comp17782_c0_seq1:67-7482(+)
MSSRTRAGRKLPSAPGGRSADQRLADVKRRREEAQKQRQRELDEQAEALKAKTAKAEARRQQSTAARAAKAVAANASPVVSRRAATASTSRRESSPRTSAASSPKTSATASPSTSRRQSAAKTSVTASTTDRKAAVKATAKPSTVGKAARAHHSSPKLRRAPSAAAKSPPKTPPFKDDTKTTKSASPVTKTASHTGQQPARTQNSNSSNPVSNTSSSALSKSGSKPLTGKQRSPPSKLRTNSTASTSSPSSSRRQSADKAGNKTPAAKAGSGRQSKGSPKTTPAVDADHTAVALRKRSDDRRTEAEKRANRRSFAEFSQVLPDELEQQNLQATAAIQAKQAEIEARQTALDNDDDPNSPSSSERSLARKQLRKSLRRRESNALIAELMPGGLDQLDSLGSRKDSLLSEDLSAPASPRRHSSRRATSDHVDEESGDAAKAPPAQDVMGAAPKLPPAESDEETEQETRPTGWEQLAITVAKQGGALGFSVKSRLEPEIQLHNYISSIKPASAASKAGLHVQDYLHSISGESVASCPKDRVKKLLVSAGNQVPLVVLRKATPIQEPSPVAASSAHTTSAADSSVLLVPPQEPAPTPPQVPAPVPSVSLRAADAESKRRQLEGRTSDLILDTVDLDAATAFEEPTAMAMSSVTGADKPAKAALSRAESRESFGQFGLRASDEDDSDDNRDNGDFSAYASEYVSEDEDYSDDDVSGADGFDDSGDNNDNEDQDDDEDFSRFGAAPAAPTIAVTPPRKQPSASTRSAESPLPSLPKSARDSLTVPGASPSPRDKRPGASPSRTGSGKSRDAEADSLSLVGYLVNELATVGKVLTGDDTGDKVDLKAEFEQVADSVVKNTTVAGQREINSQKHRHTNIMAFDHTRVKVTPDDQLDPALSDPATSDVTSDYINANYIDGYNQPQAYIATQSPIPATINAFWRMVFEQRSSVIVMLTKEMENGRLKAHRYWPEDTTTSTPSVTYSDVRVTRTAVVDQGKWVRRSFSLKRDNVLRKVEHYAMTSWPDQGVPAEPEALLELRKAVMAHARPTGSTNFGPIVVHCSSGVGRSGVFLAVDRLLNAAGNQHKPLSVPATVAELRNQRMLMVQTPAQYTFIYQALRRGLEQELQRVKAETTSRTRASSHRSSMKRRNSSAKPAEAPTDPKPKLTDRNNPLSGSVTSTASLTTTRRRASQIMDDSTLLNQGPSPPMTNDEQIQPLARKPLKRWRVEDMGSFFQYLGLPNAANNVYRHNITGRSLLKSPELTLQDLALHRAAEREYVLSALMAAQKDRSALLDEPQRNATVAKYRHKHPLSDYTAKEEPAAALETVAGSRVVRVKMDRVSDQVAHVALVVNDEDTVVTVVRQLLDKCQETKAPVWHYEVVLHTPHGEQAVTDSVVVGSGVAKQDSTDVDDDDDDVEPVVTFNSCLKQLARAASSTPAHTTPDTWLELRQLNHSKHAGHVLVRTAGTGIKSRLLTVPVTSGTTSAAVVSALLARLNVLEAASTYALQPIELRKNQAEAPIGATALVMTVQRQWNAHDCMCFELIKSQDSQDTAPLDLASVLAERNRLAADVSSLQSQLETTKAWGTELKALKADLENYDQVQTAARLEQQEATLKEANDEIENLRAQLTTLKGDQGNGDDDEATTTVAANTIQRYEKTIHALENELEQAQQAFVERSRALEEGRQELEQLCFDRATGDEDVSNAAKASLKALQASLDQRAQALTNAREAELKALRKAWELQTRLLAAGEGEENSEEVLAELEADVNAERDRLKQQVTDLSTKLESSQPGTSTSAIVVTKEAEGIPTPLLFDVVQDSLLVAVEVVKSEGPLGLVLTDTKQQVAGRRQATVTIKNVAQDSPADEAGLRAGDQLLSIDDVDLLGKDKQAALRAVRNGDDVLHLLVARPGGLDMSMAFYDDDAAMTAGGDEAPPSDEDSHRLQQELSGVQRKLKEREREAEGLRARHRALLEQNDTQREALDKYTREHQKIAAELGESTDKSAKAVDLGSQLKDLRSQKEQALLEGEKLKATVAQLQRDVKKRNKELAALQAQLKQVQATAQASTATSLSAELDETKAATKDQQSRIKRLEDELHSKSKAHEMLKASSSATEETLQGMSGALREMRDRNLELERKLEQGGGGNGAAPTSSSKKETALREQLSSVRAKHQQEMLALKKQLRELKAADKANSKKQAADRSSASTDVRVAEKALADAQAQLKKEIDAHAALLVKHDAVSGQLEALRKEHKASADKLKLATAGKQQAEAAMAATVSSLDQNLTAVTDELARVRQALKQERAAKAALEAKMEGGEAAVQKQKEEYQRVMAQRVAKLENDNAELTASRNSVAAELEQLQSELESKETMIMAMEAERDHMVGVLRDELSGQDEDKVKKKMEAKPVQESNELWDVLERKSKSEILDMLLDRDEETERLRQYVDTVTTVVMMQAPQLFEEISKSSSESKQQVGTLRQSRQRSVRKRASTVTS